MGKYHLLFKTAQAEFRCWRNFAHPRKWEITPIVELTRGRKRPKAGKELADQELSVTPGIYDFDKNVDESVEAFSSSASVILDLTREETLTCAEINQIAISQGGYQAWVSFCSGLRDRGIKGLIPVLMVNPAADDSEENYRSKLRSQCEAMHKNFGAVAYRASVLQDTEFVFDLEILRDIILKILGSGGRFILILDHEFIRSGTGLFHALRTSNLVKGIQARYPGLEFVILGTSFPSTVTELGGEDEGNFPTEESYLYDEVIRQINDNKRIYYGDYGSINPIRNDRIIARGGWRPRIDFPTSRRQIFYFREKRGEKSYSSHYESVAKKVKGSSSFENISGSWGVNQILLAAAGIVPASSPSFWISVRMEIFLHQQIPRLNQ